MISVDSSLDPADADRDSISHTKTMTTESSEDYLEAIFVIRAERGSCRNVDIAEYLGITKPSVTKALSSVDDEVASKEACRMEHCLSADSFEKFSAYLKPR